MRRQFSALRRLLARPLDDFEQLEQLRLSDLDVPAHAPSWFDRLTMSRAGLVLIQLVVLFALAVLLWGQG